MTTSSSFSAGIVEREQVLEPPLDHGLLVVGGDDHGHGRLDVGSAAPAARRRRASGRRRAGTARASRGARASATQKRILTRSRPRCYACSRAPRGSGATLERGCDRPSSRRTRGRAAPSPRGRARRACSSRRSRRRAGPAGPGGITSPQPASSTTLRRLALGVGARRSPAGRRRGCRTAGSARRSRRGPCRARRSGRRRTRATAGAARAAGRQERDRVDLEPLRERRRSSACRAPKPTITTARSSRSRDERRRADQVVEVLRVADVARVHDDEAVRRARARAPRRCRAAAA